jgi:exopolyphosphatase/guanosine-5'-triphosphate,3'-diphosphate pyrophosphatase
VAQGLGLIPGDGPGADVVTREALQLVTDRLASLPLAMRRNTPGLDPTRADLIIHGAVMLETLLTAVGVDQARVCKAALREGLILNEASRRIANASPGRRGAKPAPTRLSA